MNAGALVLVVEDEPQVRRFLRTSLDAAGYRLIEASSVSDASSQVGSHNPEVMLLDLGLPDGDGMELVARLRAAELDLPIIVVSARNRDDDKVRALDLGADDYLTKPFSAAELLARLRVALRHQREKHQGGTGQSRVCIGDELSIDFDKREVRAAGEAVHLSATEFKLLAALAQNAGKVVTHAQLLRAVWGPSHEHQIDYLRVYMTQLRRKLEANPARPRLISTEIGVGYRLREADPPLLARRGHD